MAECDECGKYENLPYQCKRCGGTFCAEHRLPENHDCPGLDNWNDPSGVFDSGFDESVENRGGRTEGVVDRLTGTGGLFGYFRGNMAYVFLGLMWVTYALEFLTLFLSGPGLFNDVFVLRSDQLFYVWTWVTSIFAHSPVSFFHIVGNSIVLYFFGPLVERYVGSKKFAALFLVSGVVAGLSHVGVNFLLNPTTVTAVLGASGAIFAVLGVLTVLNPNMKIYLYFLIPIPMWLFTLGFAVLSVVFFIQPQTAASVGQGNVAHFAHLTGLVIGLLYGERVKGRRNVPSQLQFGGGGRGPGGPGRGRF
ncbi:MAG: rhomboid family intramembrane serine protease [Haloferacaceae archaeon]